MIVPESSCMDTYEVGLKSVDAALKAILTAVKPLQAYEYVNLKQACKRVVFENIIAPFNVPLQDNSAVDGYALYSVDVATAGEKGFIIQGEAFAGKPYLHKVAAGKCIRIMTGAVIPAGLDAVVMQEHVQLNHHTILIDAKLKSGVNIRTAGEDLAQGEIVLAAGKLLTPPDIGLLASLGIVEVKVQRRLKIALISTGNELLDVGQARQDNAIYDSNRYSLFAALDDPKFEVLDIGILEDDPEVLLRKFTEISQCVDVIISSAGVSVGAADYTKTVLQQLGQIDFWKIAIKPGRPFAFGNLNQAIFFGLPGNPVAVMVTFYQFVLPALEKLVGIKHKTFAPLLTVKTLHSIRKRAGRTEIQRGILTQAPNGNLSVVTTGKQGSGILHSMSIANAFIILESERGEVLAGESVTVQPFIGWF